MSLDDLPEPAKETAKDIEDALKNTDSVVVQDGSLGNPSPDADLDKTIVRAGEEVTLREIHEQSNEREVDLDFIGEVSFDYVEDPDLGEIVEVEVVLDVDRWEYEGQRHGNAVYEVLNDFGVKRPHDTPKYGVKMMGPEIRVLNYFKVNR